MAFISALGEEQFYLVFLPLFYWSVDKRLGRRLGYIFLLAACFNNIAKNLFAQPRPFWIDPSVQLGEAEGYGLPSGHVQNATAVYLLLAAWFRRSRWWLLAGLFIFLMALSRVYLGVHFLQDVVVGFALGLLVLATFLFWQRAFAERYSKRILGRRLLLMIAIPVLLASSYLLALVIRGAPDLSVPWAAYVPAAELNAHEDVVSTIAGLLGFGVGMILESSRVRFRTEGPVWQRVARYVLGIAVAVGIWCDDGKPVGRRGGKVEAGCPRISVEREGAPRGNLRRGIPPTKGAPPSAGGCPTNACVPDSIQTDARASPAVADTLLRKRASNAVSNGASGLVDSLSGVSMAR